MTHLSRTVLYCGVSTFMTAAVILSVAEARPNFFAVAMYLSQSSACLLVLTNMFVVFTLITGKLLQRIFFGRLRAIEVDHLYERAWYAMTESCLAMTIFREEFGTNFFLFFTLLLSVKIFHWLAQDRIEYMEQTIQVPRSFHARLTSIMAILLAVDCYMVAYCLEQVFTHGPNVMIMFAFEFTILASSILAVVGKYVLNLIEARQTETWDNKSGYVFYLELVSDFIKLVTYIAFFATLMTFYGIPLHILRDLYVTFRSFTTKCRNFMRFRRATQDMDARYKNATVAEIDATGDKTCIVCREEMYHESQPQPEGEPPRTIFDNPKKLPCGHILHFRCLRSWLERQQTCPMCRRSVLDDPAPSTTTSNPAPRGAAEPVNPVSDRVNQAPPNNSVPGTSIHANNASFQMPHTGGVDPVQLPRGFRLPPGWALLPVSTPNDVHNPNSTEASQPIGESSRSDSNNNPQASLPTSRTPSVTVPRLPPIIPLFNFNGTDGHQAVTLPPELTDEQVAAMEQSTRRTVEERLRILSEIQIRLSEGFSMLSRLQNIPLPGASQPNTDSAANTGDDTSEHPRNATIDDDHVTHSSAPSGPEPNIDINESSHPIPHETATDLSTDE